jgi:hypothetical protein
LVVPIAVAVPFSSIGINSQVGNSTITPLEMVMGQRRVDSNLLALPKLFATDWKDAPRIEESIYSGTLLL